MTRIRDFLYTHPIIGIIVSIVAFLLFAVLVIVSWVALITLAVQMAYSVGWLP